MFQDLKYLTRSRSWKFMRARKSATPSVGSFSWQGNPIQFRKGTSDVEVLYRILLKPKKKQEYRLPDIKNAETILDIGANIGAATIKLKQKYSAARVFAFEPVPENFALLKKNTESLSQVSVFPFGLGAKDEVCEIFGSDDQTNQGGFSLFESGSDPTKKLEIQIRSANQVLRELKISKVDLIKIDTEGAEYSILTALDPLLLEKTTWILGELHGEKDFELLAYLDRWFSIGIDKPLGSRLSHFTAKNRTLPSS